MALNEKKPKNPAGRAKKPIKKVAVKPKQGRGRPLSYSKAIADSICEQIARGMSLASICKQAGMPPASTFRTWVIDDVDGLSARSARAYELGHDAIADDCLRIADEMPTMNPVTGAYDNGAVQHKRLMIDTRMRLLGKWSPKKYGDKIDLNHTGKVGIESLIAGAGSESGASSN